jgi:hypothetical protein
LHIANTSYGGYSGLKTGECHHPKLDAWSVGLNGIQTLNQLNCQSLDLCGKPEFAIENKDAKPF